MRAAAHSIVLGEDLGFLPHPRERIRVRRIGLPGHAPCGAVYRGGCPSKRAAFVGAGRFGLCFLSVSAPLPGFCPWVGKNRVFTMVVGDKGSILVKFQRIPKAQSNLYYGKSNAKGAML